MLSKSELERRKPIWISLSELYLDTDIEQSYGHIAAVCAASDYSLSELEAIFKDEVTPVLKMNLQSVAGHWSGFDEQWLIESLSDRVNELSTKKTLLQELKDKLIQTRYADEQWQNIALLVEKYRS